MREVYVQIINGHNQQRPLNLLYVCNIICIQLSVLDGNEVVSC